MDTGVVKYLESENERLQAELHQKSLEIADYKRRHSQLQKSYQQTESSIEEILSQLPLLSAADEKYEDRVACLKESMRRKDEKLADIREKLAGAHERELEWTGKRVELMDELARLRADLRKAEGANNTLLEEKVKVETSCAHMQEKILSMEHDLSLITTQKNSAIEEMNVKDSQHVEKVNNLKTQLENYKDRIRSDKQMIQELKETVSDRDVLVEQWHSACQERDNRIDKLQQEMQENARSLRDAIRRSKEAEIEAIDRENISKLYENATAIIAKKDDELTKKESEIVMLKGHLSQRDSQPQKSQTDAATQIDIESVKIGFYKSQLADTKSKLEQAHASIKTFEEEVSILRRRNSVRMEGEETTVAQYEHRIRNLTQQVKMLQETIEKCTKRESKLLADLVDKESLMYQLKQDIRKLKRPTASLSKPSQSLFIQDEWSMIPPAVEISLVEPGEGETIMKLDRHISNLEREMHRENSSFSGLINDAMNATLTHRSKENSTAMLQVDDVSRVNLENCLEERITSFIRK
eukprot:Partr_v1_DN28966_c1_g1_i4_m25850